MSFGTGRIAAERKREWRRLSGSSQQGRGTGPKRPWTDEEDRAVLAHRIPDRVLAARIDRSMQAIQTHRAKLRGGYR